MEETSPRFVRLKGRTYPEIEEEDYYMPTDTISWGGYTNIISQADIDHLQNGGYLFLDVGEYPVIIGMQPVDRKMQDQIKSGEK